MTSREGMGALFSNEVGFHENIYPIIFLTAVNILMSGFLGKPNKHGRRIKHKKDLKIKS